LRSCQLCTYSRTSQHFMEPESSLPCSQDPSTGPDPQPDRSSSYPTYFLAFLVVSFLLAFPTNILYAFLFSPTRVTYPAHLFFDLLFFRKNYINLLQTEILSSHIYKFSSNLTGNTLRLRYKAQPINAV
jgi:hypothetical protein